MRARHDGDLQPAATASSASARVGERGHGLSGLKGQVGWRAGDHGHHKMDLLPMTKEANFGPLTYP
jgi:hypothetical protein